MNPLYTSYATDYVLKKGTVILILFLLAQLFDEEYRLTEIENSYLFVPFLSR